MAVKAYLSQQEDDLAHRVQQGDDQAFDRLVDLCAPRMINLAYRIVGNREDAEDITQDAFLRVYQALKKFKWDSSFSTWLYRIVVNRCYDEMKQRHHRSLSLTDTQFEDDAGPSAEELTLTESTEEVWVRREWQQTVQQAILQLPRDYRLVVVLADVQGLSYQEIAEILHANIGTVKSRLNRARHQLREIFSKERELFVVPDSQTN